MYNTEHLTNKGTRMKTTTLLSLVAATVLFTACGEDTKKAVTDAATSATAVVKDTASKAAEATKEVASNAVDATKEKAAEIAAAAKEEAEKLAAEATKKAESAAAALEERAAATQAAVTPENAAGKAAYAKCAGCHGVDGHTKALGKSAVIAGQSAADLEAALAGYKAGTRNVAGMGMLMKGQVAAMDEATIKTVAEYISGL